MSRADDRLGRAWNGGKKRLGTLVISLATEGIADPRTVPITAETGGGLCWAEGEAQEEAKSKAKTTAPKHQPKGTPGCTLALLDDWPSQKMWNPDLDRSSRMAWPGYHSILYGTLSTTNSRGCRAELAYASGTVHTSHEL